MFLEGIDRARFWWAKHQKERVPSILGTHSPPLIRDFDEVSETELTYLRPSCLSETGGERFAKEGAE